MLNLKPGDKIFYRSAEGHKTFGVYEKTTNHPWVKDMKQIWAYWDGNVVTTWMEADQVGVDKSKPKRNLPEWF